MGEDNKAVVAARAYLARGLAVFPLQGKVPLTEHGVKDATHDLALVETWFKQPRNIGIAIPEGVVVVDVDPRNGGMDSFLNWMDSYPGFEDTFNVAPCAHTGGGGLHFWFRLPAGVTKLKKNPDGAPGIDLLTTGRYVVAPPSVTDEKYRWEIALPHTEDFIAELPELPGYVAALAEVEDRGGFVGTATSLPAGDPLADAARRYTTWPGLLGKHGWNHVGGPPDGDGAKFRHPASTNPFSATLKHDCLFVYSPNTPFPVTEPGDPRGITLFSAIEKLDFRDDRKAMIGAFRDLGYLEDHRADSGSITEVLSGTTTATAANRKNLPAISSSAGGAEKNPAPLAPLERPRLELPTFHDVALRRVRWVWDGRIPVGGLTLLAGREGEGKSTLAIHCMAQVTRGTLEGEYWGEPKDVIIIATEDSAEHTIKPRLLAAGADMHRVHRVEMLDPGDSLSLPVHLPDLEMACSRLDVALIVMDPLLSRLSGSLDSHKDADVRRALEPLGAFADRIHAAILGLIHLNKSGSTDPLQAVMASKAFTAFARSVLFAMVDPDDENRRLLGLVKSNLGRTDLPTLTYSFKEEEVGWDDGPIVATRIEWGDHSETNIAAALAIGPANQSKIGDATEWLEQYLVSEGGSAPASQCINAAFKVDKDWSADTLRRALRRFDGDIIKSGFPAISIWVHPGSPQRPQK